jgi:hypothetical protein
MSTSAVFEWDERKNTANIAKHGIDFRLAVQVFEGPVVTWVDDRRDYGETRAVSIGIVKGSAILTLVHTDRAGRRRIISARPASERERYRYDQAIRASAQPGGDRGGSG